MLFVMRPNSVKRSDDGIKRLLMATEACLKSWLSRSHFIAYVTGKTKLVRQPGKINMLRKSLVKYRRWLARLLSKLAVWRR